MRKAFAAALLALAIPAAAASAAAAEAGKVLFLMRADVPGGSADPAVKARLEALGYTVTTSGGLDGAPDPCGFDLVVMSSTVRSNQFTANRPAIARWRDMGVPLVTWENDLLDDLWMTGLRRDTDFGELETGHYFWLVRAPHPMAAGIPAGLGTWTEARTPAGWGKPGLGADVIMTWPGEPDKATLFGYEAGATMDHDHLAPARRVFIGMENNSFNRMTDTGRTLFDAAIQWARAGAKTCKVKK
ncbi:hypothetical protein SAMN05518849_101593 [Sphingobium sp. AP50]|uniref:hypothetical protein n=1 Tax=Sphingobium sp. AP50 TaxID=1884369 RepID=UPI0008BD8699|nr:hypothetical protein [Sphingobium sp. AP50]SEI69694.1 hypothetical protein SAMN05518849_101593 [Sphingobium sp. AP50]